MATVERANPYGTLDAERLEEFEEEVGAELPAGYRAFLLAHNGGVPVPGQIILPGESAPVGTLEELYWINDDDSSLHGPLVVMLETEAQTWPSGAWPKELLAVGATGHDEYLVCLGVAGEDYGRVYLVPQPPYGEALRGWSAWDRATLLADSFDAFVAALGGPQPGASEPGRSRRCR